MEQNDYVTSAIKRTAHTRLLDRGTLDLAGFNKAEVCYPPYDSFKRDGDRDVIAYVYWPSNDDTIMHVVAIYDGDRLVPEPDYEKLSNERELFGCRLAR